MGFFTIPAEGPALFPAPRQFYLRLCGYLFKETTGSRLEYLFVPVAF
jgi:hypothetical protein